MRWIAYWSKTMLTSEQINNITTFLEKSLDNRPFVLVSVESSHKGIEIVGKPSHTAVIALLESALEDMSFDPFVQPTSN
jgi:hypothetical protein